jgi:hypothetical protein
MVNNDLEIDADELTNVCFKAYEKNIENKNKLGKNEWTNVAAIVLFDNNRKGECEFLKNNFALYWFEKCIIYLI